MSRDSAYPDLVLAPAAQSDLSEIYLYTLDNWGSQQAQAYLANIKQAFKDLRRKPDLGRERNPLGQGVRSMNCQKHVIFYRYINTEIQIIRVLHGRQDPERHITYRF